MTLKTIVTIETSNICNLKCSYCVSRLLVQHPARRPGIMTDVVFNKALDVLRKTVAAGTQETLNLNGNGEPFLDPKLLHRISKVKRVLGKIPLQLSTNGALVGRDTLKQLKDTGLDALHISVHSIKTLRTLTQRMRDVKFKMPGVVNLGTHFSPHNWAGQLEPENSVQGIREIPCLPLQKGYGYIQKEGQLSPCCYDYRHLGMFGTVFDKDIMEREIKRYELCDTCHQKIN